MQSEKIKEYRKKYNLENKEKQLEHVKNSQNRCRFNLKCDICQMTFPSISYYDNHMICKLHLKNIELNKNPNIYICCGINHQRESTLFIHQKSKLHIITTNPKIYTCECCNIDHKTKAKLNKHIEYQLHIKNQPIKEKKEFNCCGKKYCNQQTYNTHLNSKKHKKNIENIENNI
jgi:hypothetical protein